MNKKLIRIIEDKKFAEFWQDLYSATRESSGNLLRELCGLRDEYDRIVAANRSDGENYTAGNKARENFIKLMLGKGYEEVLIRHYGIDNN